jgi:hypothetical protein
MLSHLCRDNGTPNHHSPHTNNHHPPKPLGINRNNNPDILPINIQPTVSPKAPSTGSLRRSNSHRIDSIILSLNQLWFPQNPIHRDMKPMIILRRQPENPQRTTLILVRLVSVRRPQQPLRIEIAALDPNLGCLFNLVKDDAAAVCGGDDDRGIVGGGAGAGIGFEFAVKEFVEIFEFFDGEEDV